MAQNSTADAAPFVQFNCEYRPNIAGGEFGKFATENYRLRVDYFGTHQLGHNGCTTHKASQTVLFHSPADPHKFPVRVDLHQPARNERLGSGILLPFYEAGAYEKIVPVAEQPEMLEIYPPQFKVAASTSVILVFYATTFTTLKQRCWCNVGTVVVPVDVLIDLERKPGSNVVFDVIHNRGNDDDEEDSNIRFKPPKKGKVVISAAAVNNIVLRPTTEFDTYAKNSNRREIAAQIERVIRRSMSPFFEDKKSHTQEVQFLGTATKAFLGPYHVPRFTSGRYELPSSNYPLIRCKRPLNIPCYEQFLDIALARSGTTRDEALQWSEFLNARQLQTPTARPPAQAFLNVAVRMITVFPLSQRYMDDVLNRNQQGTPWRDDLVQPDEDFKICRLCGGDDCEGVCLEAMMISEATAEEYNRMSPLLRRVADLLKLFVPLMTLGCVTNRKATAAPLDDSNALAHTFCMLMPFWQFYELCHESQRKVLLSSRFYQSRKAALEPYRESPNYFNSVIAEATAPIHPAMRPVESYYTDIADRQQLAAAIRTAQEFRTLEDAVIAVLDRYDLAEVLQPEMFGPPDTRVATHSKHDYSQFYKYLMACATPAFADLRRLDFAFALNVNSNDERSYGVPFNQIIDYDNERGGSVGAHTYEQSKRQHQKPGLMAYLELTEHDAKLCDAIILDIPPVPLLELPSPASTTASLNTERINRWTLMLEKLVKRPTAANRKPDTAVHRRLQYLTIAEPDVNAAVIESLRQIAMLPQVVSFAYAWYALNAPMDGTDENNVILDIYLGF